MRKLLAFFVIVLGLLGVFAVTAPAATAVPVHFRGTVDGDPPNDGGVCLRINVTVKGNQIGTGPDFICLP